MINTYGLIDWTQPEADSGLLWTQDSSPSVNLYPLTSNHCLIHSLIYPPIHPSIQIHPVLRAVSYLSNGFANPALYFSDFLNSSPIVLNIFRAGTHIIESWITFLTWCFGWMNLRQEVVPYSFSVKLQEEESWEWPYSYSKGLKFFKLRIQMFLTGAECSPQCCPLGFVHSVCALHMRWLISQGCSLFGNLISPRVVPVLKKRLHSDDLFH